jgi:hypothetical protein
LRGIKYGYYLFCGLQATHISRLSPVCRFVNSLSSITWLLRIMPTH